MNRLYVMVGDITRYENFGGFSPVGGFILDIDELRHNIDYELLVAVL